MGKMPNERVIISRKQLVRTEIWISKITDLYALLVVRNIHGEIVNNPDDPTYRILLEGRSILKGCREALDRQGRIDDGSQYELFGKPNSGR